tara:strand:+ start:116 stop:601 length:486 start_codon:yes stop_codon:yes gene_type:complete
MNQERIIYDFRSVGKTIEKVQEEQAYVPDNVPIGIKTPMEFAASSGNLFEMHTDIRRQIRDNFRNMLATNHGERLILHDFGANLGPIAFELGKQEIDELAINRISATTSKYMPFISLKTFESFERRDLDKEVEQVGIRVVYDIPSLVVENEMIEILVYGAG